VIKDMEVSDTENIVAHMRYAVFGDLLYVMHLEVEEEYRRHGIARSIVESLEGKLCLEVRVDNDAAIALYAGCGLRVLGRIPRYYEDGADAYYMERHNDETG
jgi:ribosomal-protein-alanine N-acetyltransferase